jgi:hypothetical protein
MNRIRIAAVAAIAVAMIFGAVSTTASAATQPATQPATQSASTSNAAADTQFCYYTPRGTVSHYFSLATGQRVVKGQYNHGQQFLIQNPPTRYGLNGITYWKLPNGYWIDSAGIIRVSSPCMTT